MLYYQDTTNFKANPDFSVTMLEKKWTLESMKYGIWNYKGNVYEIKCTWKTSPFELSWAQREGPPPRKLKECNGENNDRKSLKYWDTLKL